MRQTNVLVKHSIYYELKLFIMDLDLQITRKHPVDAQAKVKSHLQSVESSVNFGVIKELISSIADIPSNLRFSRSARCF